MGGNEDLLGQPQSNALVGWIVGGETGGTTLMAAVGVGVGAVGDAGQRVAEGPLEQTLRVPEDGGVATLALDAGGAAAALLRLVVKPVAEFFVEFV